jgi:hypothetical protein
MKQRRSKSLSTGLKQSTDKPALLEAIEITIRTIEGRARLYRDLVIAVSGVSILSVLSAVLFRHWLALAGLSLLVPLTGGFLFLDSRRLRGWRIQILEKSALRGLDLLTFRKTISGFRHLPTGSLQAMLSTIPSKEDFAQRQRQERNVIGDEFDRWTRKHEWRILGATGLLTLALICLAGAAIYHSLTLLFWGAGMSLLLALFRRK